MTCFSLRVTRGLYEQAGLPNHPNCRDNLLFEIKKADIALPVVPDPVNFFQRSEPQSDGRLEVLASDNPPGGNVLLRAETNLYVVVTACSVDFHPTNGGVVLALRLLLVNHLCGSITVLTNSLLYRRKYPLAQGGHSACSSGPL